MKKMSAGVLTVGGALLASVASVHAQTVVADYTADFKTPTPMSGWSYLWNPTGALGNSANYSPLAVEGTRYETVANSMYPDPDPGRNLFVAASSLFPGAPGTGNGPDHYAILAYTFSAADIAAAGGGSTVNVSLPTYSFAPQISGTSDGLDAVIFINNKLIREQALPPVTPFSSSEFGAFPIGPAQSGDTLYIAIGPSGPGAIATQTHGTDTDDELTLSFTIAVSAVPEPATAATVALGSVAALRRRRWR